MYNRSVNVLSSSSPFLSFCELDNQNVFFLTILFLVQDALQKLMVGRTTIIIAHRLSTIKAAHQVAVVDNGRIAESGTYEKLIQLDGGLFRKLVEKQSTLNDRQIEINL